MAVLCTSPMYHHFFVGQGHALSCGKRDLPRENEVQQLQGAPYHLENKNRQTGSKGLIEDKHPFIKSR